jgi:DNA-binding NarL/FixJ family response regulator
MRILIADDDERVRRAVIGMISAETDWTFCGEASDGAEALRKARVLLPDLILIDISMPGLNGFEVSRVLRQEMSTAKIVIMSQHDPVRLLPPAIEAGAHACVDKGNLATDLLRTIESVAASESRALSKDQAQP